VQGDVAALDRIFADDLVYFHSNGLSDPKSGVLQSSPRVTSTSRASKQRTSKCEGLAT
jgi:hypothetical protein